MDSQEFERECIELHTILTTALGRANLKGGITTKAAIFDKLDRIQFLGKEAFAQAKLLSAMKGGENNAS